MGWHWKKKEVLKHATAELLGVYARLSGVRLVTHLFRPVRRVHILCVYSGGERLPDPHNLYKITCDALALCRLIWDDGEDWCDMRRPTLQRGSHTQTVFTLTDLVIRPPCRPEDDPVAKRMLAQYKRKGAKRGPG
jgi:hypothetical protein